MPAHRRNPSQWRVLLVGGLLLAIFAGVAAYLAMPFFGISFGHGPPKVIASFVGDYQEEKPKPNWLYLWNATGPIGTATNYAALQWNDVIYRPYKTEEYPQPRPAHFLRLGRGTGHPGQGPAQTRVPDFDERFVIIGFVVSDPGRYWLTNSTISRHVGRKEGNIHLQVFVNDTEIGHSLDCRSNEGIPFNRSLGRLSTGDTIYVAIGPGETDVNDSFDLDFAIARSK